MVEIPAEFVGLVCVLVPNLTFALGYFIGMRHGEEADRE